MTSSVEDELRKTNANLQTMLNMQKMIIDALMPKAKPAKEEIEAFEEEEEFVSLEKLKEELGKG
ncbi:MAG: hypothetical protein D6778_09745 [Nitrospirae bacterium]|nr:MAG: hypothetical protein D6778_09745 [Nitrospirota bacterium]